MKKANSKKIVAGLVGSVMICSAVSSAAFAEPAVNADLKTSGDIIYSTDFENSVIDFTGRGGVETIEATTEQAHSGKYSMCTSGRTKSWNGPQFLLDNLCEAGVEYSVSAWVRAEWYNNICLSMEYTDSSGERHYSNLKSVTNQGGDWSEISNIKFSFADDVTNVYLYFEANDISKIYVDDFTISTVPAGEIQQDIPSLKEVYADRFKIGGAVTASELAPQAAKELIKKHYNSITLGNELKPDSILDKKATLALMEETGDDTDPQVNIASARSILNFCRDNDIPVRGHVLVWHSQTPDWFFKEGFSDDGDWVTPEVMLKRMENYIKNVMTTLAEEYPEINFYAWDIVNEAWKDNGRPRDAGSNYSVSGQSAWVKVFGDNSFIEPAFEFARKYAPEGCKLYYNDYNEYMPQKTQAMYDMAMELKEKGLIDGIGMQSHLDVNFPSVSVYRKALDKFASTGLDIQVTELDITTSDTSAEGFKKQAQMYSDLFDAYVEYSDSISAIVLWGTTDDKSWRASRCPLLFNEDFTAKPSFYSIVD